MLGGERQAVAVTVGEQFVFAHPRLRERALEGVIGERVRADERRVRRHAEKAAAPKPPAAPAAPQAVEEPQPLAPVDVFQGLDLRREAFRIDVKKSPIKS